MLITALLMTAALTGLQAAGEPTGEPDSVVATAPATSVALDAIAGPVAPPVGSTSQTAFQAGDAHGLSTDQQISQWLAARAPDPSSRGDAPLWRDDRKVHGEVSVGVGTGGYRDYGAAMSVPFGENGRLDLSIRQVENGYPYGYGYGDHGYGYGAEYGYSPFDDGDYAFRREDRLSLPGDPDRSRAVRPPRADQK